tara:strand:+ start:89903 stop:90829 length:927 start_codon:yes stop_codon:yes gene_type:complete
MSKEIKSLILVIAGIILFLLGFNFLKGTSFFSNQIQLFAIYKNVEGLQNGTSVNLNGLNIGKVTSIDLLEDTSVIVTFNIRDDLKFSKNSIAELYESGLIGGKSIAIIPKFDSNSSFKSGDTLQSRIKPGLTQTISDRIVPLESKIESILTNADSLFMDMNDVLDLSSKRDLRSIISNLNSTLDKVNSISFSLDKIIQSELNNIRNTVSNFNDISSNVKVFSDSINYNDFNKSLSQINNASVKLNSILEKIDKSQGDIGKLINDDNLYTNLDATLFELNKLIIDFRSNPKRYVHFSIFGKKNKQYEKK